MLPLHYAGNNPVSLVDPTGRTYRGYAEDEEAQRQAEYARQNEIAHSGPRDPGNLFETDDDFYSAEEGALMSAIEMWGDMMAKNNVGWGKSDYAYNSADEAAKAAFYVILKNTSSFDRSLREYGGVIYKNDESGKYTFSRDIIQGDNEAISFEMYRDRAIKDGHNIGNKTINEDFGLKSTYEVVGAAVYHTHPRNSSFSLWKNSHINGGADTKFAYYFTSEQTVYVLLPRGNAYKWQYNYYIHRYYIDQGYLPNEAYK